MAVFRHTVAVDTGASPANLRELEERSDRLERSLRTVESRAGKVGSASTKLAGALGRVSPELAESAMLVNDLADGMEVATMVGPRLLAILGPVGVAVGVLAGAFFLLNSRLNEATEAMEENAAAATRMQRLSEELAQASDRAAVARGDMTLEELVHTNAMKAGNDVFAERRAELEANVRERERLAAAASRNFAAESQSIAQRSQRAIDEQAQNRIISDGIRLLDQQKQGVIQANEALERARTELSRMEDQQAKYVADLETINNANSSAASSFDKLANSASDAAEAIEEVVQTFDPSSIQGITPDLGRLIPAIDIDDILARDQVVTDAMIAQSRQQTLGQVAGAVQMAGAPAQALGMLGPVGAIVGGLASIGAAGGASGVEKQLDTLIDNITDGILALPEILIEVIPEFVFALVTELPPALARAIEDVFIRLLNLIPGVNIRTGGQGPDSLSTAAAGEQEDRLQALQQAGVVSESGVIFGLGTAGGSAGSRSRQASSRGRVARADGAVRMAMSRAPTAQMMGQSSLTINALGIDDGTQDQFQRRFARYTDPVTGLRGRDG